MGKTKEVYQVRVYFSKDEFLEWDNVTEMDTDCLGEYYYVSFVDSNGREVQIDAPTKVIVVTKRNIESY